MNIMQDITMNIIKWTEIINNYNSIEQECLHNINNINEIKNTFNNLLGNQNKDDVIFYTSLINNSYYYLFNSIKIRKNKFIKDLNLLWYKKNNNKYIDDINKSNIIILFKDYQTMADDIKYAHDNSNSLAWVKKDIVDSMNELEANMNEILNYHMNIINHFSDFIKLEIDFYCGDFMPQSPTIV